MDIESVTVLVKWRVKDGHLSEVLELVEEMGKESSSETGNLAYDVYQDEEDLQSIYLYESYANPAAAKSHKESKHYQSIVVGKIIPLLEEREVTRVKSIFKK